MLGTSTDATIAGSVDKAGAGGAAISDIAGRVTTEAGLERGSPPAVLASLAKKTGSKRASTDAAPLGLAECSARTAAGSVDTILTPAKRSDMAAEEGVGADLICCAPPCSNLALKLATRL
ncbi:hypothetical protein, partial [Chromobacterium amazonense]|uniref:hypothetical protein n=1 Tax=Chromobacterium amazonense TaxID=1382803 RepID=UPI003F7A3EB6